MYSCLLLKVWVCGLEFSQMVILMAAHPEVPVTLVLFGDSIKIV